MFWNEIKAQNNFLDLYREKLNELKSLEYDENDFPPPQEDNEIPVFESLKDHFCCTWESF